MTEKEKKAIVKWKFLLQNQQEINDNDHLSNQDCLYNSFADLKESTVEVEKSSSEN